MLIGAACLTLALPAAEAVEEGAPSLEPAAYVPNQLIVKYRPGHSPTQCSSALEQLHQQYRLVKFEPVFHGTAPALAGVYLLTFQEVTDVAALAREYAADPAVEYAEPNALVRTQ